jgi:hypothetical protein
MKSEKGARQRRQGERHIKARRRHKHDAGARKGKVVVCYREAAKNAKQCFCDITVCCMRAIKYVILFFALCI